MKGRTGGAAKDVHHMFTTLKKSVSNTSTEGLKKPASASKTKPVKPVAKSPTFTKGKRNTGVKSKKMPTGAKKQTKAGPMLRGKKNVQTEADGPAQRTRQKTAIAKSLEKSKKPIAGPKSALNRLSQYKSKTNGIKPLRREKVPETNFGLRYFPWSSWKVVISKTAKDGLIPMFDNSKGNKKAVEYNATTIFDGKTKRPALYEFAVRLPGCTKKAVYVKSSSGFTPHFWRTTLFPSVSLRKQVQNIVRKQNGDILVRRLVLKKFQKYNEIPSIMKNYDYVWVPADGAEKYRGLRNDSYVISEEMDVD